jgi:NADPH-dependent 2,4-dienoyl-CoA reductase/sulfur reductase-like enzyme/nitrite reductase/ring-hydroxylating ferredoxin subunit
MRTFVRNVRLHCPHNKFVCQQARNFSNGPTKHYSALKSSELQEGEHKVVNLSEDSKAEMPILISRFNSKVYATSAKCSHYDVNLGNGTLVKDRIYCPKHFANFSIVDGSVEGGPILDGIATFPALEKDGMVHVEIPTTMNHKKEFPKAK